MSVRAFVDAFNLRPVLPDATLQSCLAEALLQLAAQHAARLVSDLFLLLLSDAAYVRRQLVQRVMSSGGNSGGSFGPHMSAGWSHRGHTGHAVAHFLSEFTAYTSEALCKARALDCIQRVSDLLQLTSSSNGSKSALCMPFASSSSSSSSYAIGCAALDRLFARTADTSGLPSTETLFGPRAGAGLAAGWVTEVAGEAGTGKTQLLLQVLLQSLAETQAGQLLLDVVTEATEKEEEEKERKAVCEGGAGASLVQVRRVLQRTAQPRAALYLAAEDIPAARLASLAAGAVTRVQHAALRHALLTALPSSLYATMQHALQCRLTPEAVLGKLQVKSIASLHELLRLLRDGTLHHALRLWGGGQGGVVALDSIAAAANKAAPLTSAKGIYRARETVCREESSGRRSHSSSSSSTTTSASNSSNTRAGQSNSASGRFVYDEAALLREVGVWLRALAVNEQACVLVANQVRAIPVDLVARYTPLKRRRDYNKEVNAPALGITWATTPHVRLLLRRGQSGLRQLTLLACPALPPAQHTFVITQHGIEADEGA